jgi:hypothetical protein
MTKLKILLPAYLLLLLLTVFSIPIPFFWDSAFFSAVSVYFYDHGMNGFITPLQHDTGGFPLFSSYLTLVWIIFGKTLAVSHLAILPFLIGVVNQFYLLAKRFLNDKTIVLALILLLIEPVFITQSILMGYDILMVYFFLLSLNALYDKKELLFSIAFLFLSLISIRGIMLASALFIIDLFLFKKIDRLFIRKYLPAVFICVIWFIYHKTQTGWFLFSPTRENNAEQFSGAVMMLRQFVYIIWKTLDLGRITLWILFITSAMYFLKHNKASKTKELIALVFIPLIALTFLMLLIKNPIGHKYFLIVFVLLNIGVCYCLEQLESRKKSVLLFCLISTSLIGGNFIFYPQRYGNAWDASLKVLPYFKLDAEMKAYLLKNAIPDNQIGTQFPLTTKYPFSHLSDAHDQYIDIEDKPIKTFQYFLYSNIINTNRMSDLEKITTQWLAIKKMKCGTIELTLYQNPDF